jgi:hypothetical protein
LLAKISNFDAILEYDDFLDLAEIFEDNAGDCSINLEDDEYCRIETDVFNAILKNGEFCEAEVGICDVTLEVETGIGKV